MKLLPSDILPVDYPRALLVGRIWIDGPVPGPRIFVIRNDDLIDISDLAPTMSDLLDLFDPLSAISSTQGRILCSLSDALQNNMLLAPCDLQAVKAAGVTFIDSLLERVIEERALGNAVVAAELRDELEKMPGQSFRDLKPGSAAAAKTKEILIKKGLWSQYLEVGIGPDPEIFTKALPMSSVGCGAEIGVHPRSKWNNTEPEIVLALSSRGEPVGASLGNDMTLRDFEGRSALLLPKAKDNNASCAIGPFIRLFDKDYTLDDVRSADINLRICGNDNFSTSGTNSMKSISRDPEELISATIGPEHQYPDGLMLFLGTMFVPNEDRDEKNFGFTHKLDDHVMISTPKLGALHNRITTSDKAAPWNYGIRALMHSLGQRGLLDRSSPV